MAVRIRALCALCLAVAGLPITSYAQSTKDRIEQIRKLGKTDSQAIPELTKYLSDQNSDVRAEAVRAIVKIGTEHSLDPLVKAAGDSNAQVAILATDGIVNFYLPGYVANGMFSHSLNRGMKEMKSLFSVRNRQEIGPEITVRPNVQQALANEVAHASSVEARTNAARAAGILHAQAAVSTLVEALHSKETQLILESLYSLQKIGDPAAGPGAAFLVRDLDDKVQLAAIETVGVLRDQSSAGAIRSVIESPRNDKTKRAAMQALAMFGISDDRALFQRYAADKDATTRAAATEGLGRVRDPQDTPLLDSAFNEKDADWRIHLAAAFALVSEGKLDTAEFSPLRYLVENLDQANRDETAQAYLTELCRGEPVRKSVYVLLPQTSVAEKVALCKILASTHAPDVIPVLQDLAKDPNSDVSLTAAKSLRIAQARQP